MKIALGTVQMGLPYGVSNTQGQVSLEEATKMLQLAAKHGVDTLDTAVGYGNSEARLGQIGLEGFKVITKLPAVPQDCKEVRSWVRSQVGNSLDRLSAPFLDGLLLHRPEQLCDVHGDEIYRALLDEIEAGRIKRIGVSIYSPDLLKELTSKYRFGLVQAPFNLLDRRLATSGWLGRLKEAGVEVHVRSVFLQGLLLMEQQAIPAKFQRWASLWQQWHDWLTHTGTPALSVCLAFVAAYPEIDKIVVGADSAAQLGELINASNYSLEASLPDLVCDDERLINPACWNLL